MPTPSTTIKRRILRRVPVRLRQYWKLLAGCVAVIAVLTVVFSTVRVQPYVTSGDVAAGDDVTQDIAGSKDLFDPTVAHRIKITFRDADYQRLLDSFYKEGAKDYLEADITIDGAMIPSVGIRLKGNSTLMGLTRNGESPQRSLGGRGGAQGAPAAEGDFPGPTRGTGGGFGRSSLKAEEPERLPWLIRFDEFVDGRRYQGHREIALRVAGMGGGSAVLNEALSLELLASAGEIAQGYAYTSFTVNDRPTTARLVLEHPDEQFAATELGSSGVLYKGLASGQFTDQGDDPTAYGDDFEQVTMNGSQDLQPVIDLVQWVNNSSDAEFDEELADHVDVESFARYLAAQNLLLNFDDMAGPGRNYYLWYDLATRKFKVIGWDYNLTFSGSADQGPHDSTGRGGGFPGGGFPGGLPDGVQPPDGMQVPEGVQPPGGEAGGGGRAGAPGGFGGNRLKERFLASSAFTAVYESAYRELYQAIYGSGNATAALDGIAKVVSTLDGRDGQALSDEAGRLRTLIQQRTASLAANGVIAGG